MITRGGMEEIRVHYTRAGEQERMELLFPMKPGHSSARDVAVAIMAKEFPSKPFPSGPAEDVLRDNGITMLSSPDILPI
jgi:hypothetical protein